MYTVYIYIYVYMRSIFMYGCTHIISEALLSQGPQPGHPRKHQGDHVTSKLVCSKWGYFLPTKHGGNVGIHTEKTRLQ